MNEPFQPRLSPAANLAVMLSLVVLIVWTVAGVPSGILLLTPLAVFTVLFWLAGDPLWNRVVEPPKDPWNYELQKLLATRR